MSVRIKPIAIPPEHGSWGFLLEPLVMGLGVAPSVAGLGLALGVTGAFLIRQPVKIVAGDWQRGKRYARTRLAEKFALAYGALAATGFALAVALTNEKILLPFLLSAPLALIVFFSTTQNRGRGLLPELAGATALALAASGLALAGDKSWDLALTLWAIQTARNIPSILYIRARLRLERDKPHHAGIARAANLIAVIMVLILVFLDLAPAPVLIAMIVLMARALWGLSPYRRPVSVPRIGVMELLLGLLTALLTIIGYHS